ncbi:MAG: divalent-cation tolerance protein CutA [Candidatus Lokiarchaeota archaeon]|nr:divalent-cation tolerance protein CutA [Candidatus Lokiarchaeota archaeon]
MSYLICLITCSPKQSKEIARSLVKEKLVACVNIISNITSIYKWKDKVEEDSEDLLICKTLSKNQENIIKKVKEIHDYEVPETIFTPIIKGNDNYLKWITENVT